MLRLISGQEFMQLSDICFKRPGTGLLPTETHKVLYKRVKRYIKKNTLIQNKNIF